MALFGRSIFASRILAFMPTGIELSTRSHAEIYIIRIERHCAIETEDRTTRKRFCIKCGKIIALEEINYEI